MVPISKNLFTERDLGILILKMAAIFIIFALRFRHFMITVIWQVIKGNLMVLISKNLFTGLEFGIFILKLATITKMATIFINVAL